MGLTIIPLGQVLFILLLDFNNLVICFGILASPGLGTTGKCTFPLAYKNKVLSYAIHGDSIDGNGGSWGGQYCNNAFGAITNIKTSGFDYRGSKPGYICIGY